MDKPTKTQCGILLLKEFTELMALDDFAKPSSFHGELVDSIEGQLMLLIIELSELEGSCIELHELEEWAKNPTTEKLMDIWKQARSADPE